MSMNEAVSSMKNIKRIIFISLLLLGSIVFKGCKQSDYPYYIQGTVLGKVKPVFIILVDSSGSNASNISYVNQLVADSKDYLLKTLYNNDEETMDKHLFIGTYPNGEEWLSVLISKPSELIAGSDPSIDDHPNRVIVFYGNGVGVSNQAARDVYFTETQNFIQNDYAQLEIYLGRLVMTPGADSYYSDWAKTVINGEALIPSVTPFDPPMSTYDMKYQALDPSTMNIEAFLDEIIQAIKSKL